MAEKSKEMVFKEKTAVNDSIIVKADLITQAIAERINETRRISRVADTLLTVERDSGVVKPSNELYRVVTFVLKTIAAPIDTVNVDEINLKELKTPTIISKFLIPSALVFDASNYLDCTNHRCFIEVQNGSKEMASYIDVGRVAHAFYNSRKKSDEISSDLYSLLRPQTLTASTPISFGGKAEDKPYINKVVTPSKIAIRKESSYCISINEDFERVITNIFLED
jgi:hypothetical protein